MILLAVSTKAHVPTRITVMFVLSHMTPRMMADMTPLSLVVYLLGYIRTPSELVKCILLSLDPRLRKNNKLITSERQI